MATRLFVAVAILLRPVRVHHHRYRFRSTAVVGISALLSDLSTHDVFGGLGRFVEAIGAAIVPVLAGAESPKHDPAVALPCLQDDDDIVVVRAGDGAPEPGYSVMHDGALDFERRPHLGDELDLAAYFSVL